MPFASHLPSYIPSPCSLRRSTGAREDVDIAEDEDAEEDGDVEDDFSCPDHQDDERE